MIVQTAHVWKKSGSKKLSANHIVEHSITKIKNLIVPMTCPISQKYHNYSFTFWHIARRYRMKTESGLILEIHPVM